ncbi:MAG: type II toxin-antitoxin system RelE/ParE family toxin [Alphaproteobacteria bacterium]|uniref:Type II toxin-antitoxin system RelE/ParE family toxin n=1 Tax=Candidatus Nitrobium versatile TaxID=2884831 RepID=A0A953J2A3_9BACT|nr:type II toxin-antitoxin system RelE/ParE family toxin [Candidatus Nitrobium versatile]
MYTLIATRHFLRSSKKFLRKHPDLRARFAKVIDEVKEDPFQPHLTLHPLGGNLEGIFSVSLTYSYRITLTLKITEKEIILLDIGSHEDVYRK